MTGDSCRYEQRAQQETKLPFAINVLCRHATHSGEYQGHPPTGKTITVTGISIFRLADGKIQEITVNMDRLGQAQQLGWLPAPAPPVK